MRISYKLIIISAIISLIFSCGSEDVKVKNGNTDEYPLIPAIADKQLNISILLDLSNRIDPALDHRSPSQVERDLNVIMASVNAAKKNVKSLGTFKANTRLNVFFHPEPQDASMKQYASALSANFINTNDLAKAGQNKLLYNRIDTVFTAGAKGLYDLAVKRKSYPGSDIWRFMQDEAKLKCIERDSSFRNILIILTDGYMYYQNGKYKKPGTNRFNYIERTEPHFTRFRSNNLLLSEFDQLDYGFIPATSALENLEILVLECNPDANNPQDFDIMKKYWCKWFKEMGVKHSDIYKSQQPSYHQKIIGQFLQLKKGLCTN